MSSPKREFGGYGLPANPSDGVRARRLQAAPTAGSLPRLVNPSAFRDAQPMKAGRERQQQQSRIPSRLPQSPPKTSPGLSAASSRPRHIQEPRTVSIPAVGTSMSHPQSKDSSGSFSSLLSNESATTNSDDRFGKRTAVSPRNVSGPRFDNDRRLSMSPGRQSIASLDEAMNIYMEKSPHIGTSSNVWQHPTTTSSSAGTTIYPELDRYRNHEHPALAPSRYGTDDLYKLSTQDLPSFTPPNNFSSGSSSQLSAASASPSTKFSESPGPGPYSRDTTPTSISSQSPGIVVPIRTNNAPKTKQLSPAKSRPPVTRRRAGSLTNDAESPYLDPQGLAAVRESLTSSSSNSTVRDGDKASASRKKPTKLPPPPPSPPPRKSSQKFRRNADKDKASGTPPPKSTNSLKDQAATSPEFNVGSPRPSRPSRRGTPDLKSQLFDPVPVIHSNLRPRPAAGVRRGSDTSLSSLPLPTTKTKSASTSNLPVGSKTEQDVRVRTSEDSRPQPTPAQPNPKTASSTRFTLFGKKKPSSGQEEKREGRKLVRKGPAAGTGHEGYGRLGSVRRRSGSQNLAFNYAGPQQSQESVISEDSFLAERMNPVVIIGGSLDLSRTTSNVSQPTPRSSTDSRSPSEPDSSTAANNSSEGLRPSPMPLTLGLSSFPLPPNSSDSDEATAPSLALRRSMQRLKTAPDSPLRLPQPIKTIQIAPSPLTSLDTSLTSGDSRWVNAPRTSEDLRDAHPAPRKLKKRAKSPRKWNLFGRSEHNESKKSNPAVSATVTAVEKRPVPFYAMIDSTEQEPNEEFDVQAVLHHAGLYSNSPPKLSLDTGFNNAPPNIAQGVPLPRDRPAGQVSRKPSRLQQVGRIPQVVSRGNEKPSPKSFSRPFRASLQRPVSIPGFYDPDSIAKGPSPPRSSTPLPDLVLEGSTLETSTVPSTDRGSLVNEPGDGQHYGKEFLSFSPRKYSSGTTGTSSSSSAYGSFATATAIIPKPDDPPAEDEVWDEYDDLLGDDTIKAPQSATAPKGVPFHLETYRQKLTKSAELESPVVADTRKVSTCSTNISRSSYCSEDMTERIKAAFQPHSSPTAGATFENDSSAKKLATADTATSSAKRQSSNSSKARYSNDSSSSFDYSSPLALVNLRVGSMTVSKWLTFGHVLFSDLRHELLAAKGNSQAERRCSILVIDGLGNDDWSFYVAETYPEANFFNLSPRAPVPEDVKKNDSTALLSPSNHHQVQYLSHMDKFPFAPQSFDSVVYRFPVAAPESHYRNIISESRRVLKPGGYIELALLDLDLNNMGNRGRRTIRQLKENIHEASPDTSLRSAADLILKYLGSGGFSGIRAAKVGIPVASSITQPDGKGKSKETSNRGREPPSLSEMMKDTSPAADANITKMVTRVGRWWYTRCYEYATNSPAGNGIWADKALLSECQEMGTSLKLTVCCARAPDRVTSY